LLSKPHEYWRWLDHTTTYSEFKKEMWGKILNMEFFQLHHPLNATVLCDRKGCEQVADYLEVDDHGQEYRLCVSHTASKTHSSRLPTRKPSPDLPFRSRPAAWTVGDTPAPSEL
jgi:hypothetical protein